MGFGRDDRDEASPPQVVETTVGNYSNGKVLVFLDDRYLDRAWCLLEASVYTSAPCRLFVVGACQFIQGRDFFGGMEAGWPDDIPLIQGVIERQFGSRDGFNRRVDEAIVRLSGPSLMWQSRYAEALAAFEREHRAAGEGDREALAASLLNMGRAYGRLGRSDEALEALGETLRLFVDVRGGEAHADVADVKHSTALVFADRGQRGAVMYLQVMTRPDLAQACLYLSQFLEALLKWDS